MRRLTMLFPMLMAAPGLPAVAQTLAAAPSTRATTVVSLSAEGAAARHIRLDYGQPHLRGRTLHRDSLVPLDMPWRLGANAATTLETEVPITLGGAALAAGRYRLEALPGQTAWQLLVRPITGTDAEGDPIVGAETKIPLRLRRLAAPVESLSMWLIPSRAEGAPHGELRFAWGTFELSADWRVAGS